MYTHVDTNKWLSDALNFKKQGNYTQRIIWATLYTKFYGKNTGSNFGLIYQTRGNAKLIRQAQRQIIPQASIPTDALNVTRKVNRQAWSSNVVQTRRKQGRINWQDK